MIHEFDNNPNRRPSPFKVPEGYFDTLASRVMEKIPDNEVRMIPVQAEKPAKTSWWRTIAAAAAIAVAVFGIGLFMHNGGIQENGGVNEVAQMASYNNADGNLEAVADYIMCDDDDLYAYLSDE